MKISPRRIEALLSNAGFELAWKALTTEFGFTRATSATPSLFDVVTIGVAGRTGEAIFADLGASVLRAWPTKGLIETEPLRELDAQPDQRWSIIATDDHARRWESQLLDVVLARVGDAVANLGPPLLARTGTARDAVARYLGRLPAASSAEEVRQALLDSCGSRERQIAARLRNWPGVLQFEGGEVAYDIATLLIARYGVELGDDQLREADPLTSTELMWRIQILRDRVVTQEGLTSDPQGGTADS